MSLLGLFAASVHGMTSQSDAMNAIAGNIANLRTGGYKRTDVQFATVLSQSISSENGSGGSASGSSQADFGGAIANNYARIATQGQIEASDRPLDIAINGNRGFFVVSPELDGSGESLFTRDGTFSIDVGADTTVMGIGGTPITVQEGYLVDKNGYFLQGWEYDPNGAYGSDLSSMQPLRVDNFAFSGVGEATTSAELSLNLPATESAGDFESFLIDVVDSAGNPWGLQTHFIKDTSVNSWLFDIAVAGGGSGTSVTLSPPADYSVSTEATQETVFDATTGTIRVQEAGTGVLAIDALRGLTAGDSFTIAGTALNDGTYTVQSVAADGASLIVDPATPLAADETTATTTTISASGVLGQSLSFAPDGSLASPTQYVVAITHPGGTTSNFTLDVSSITQFAGAFQPGAYTQNGFPASDMTSVYFDDQGHVIGKFQSGYNKKLYRIGLANFPNPDGLSRVSGNVFSVSADSGAASVGLAGQNGVGSLIPSARELSNVDLAQEFSNMIKTQTVYNASATSLRTQDEMLQKLDEL